MEHWNTIFILKHEQIENPSILKKLLYLNNFIGSLWDVIQLRMSTFTTSKT